MIASACSRRLAAFVLVVLASLPQAAAQAPNDTCSTALFVSDGVNGPYNNAGADTSVTVSCSTSAGDVWFRYTATRTGTYTISTCTPPGQTPGSMSDTVLSVHASCLAGPLALACNDDSCASLSSLTLALTQGSTYRIRVASGFLMFPLGTFWLTIDPPAPTNDDCTSGVPVLSDGVNPAAPAGASGYWFSNVDALTSQAIPTACPAFNEVWFHYTATMTGPTTITTCTPPGFEAGSLADTLLSVHPGDCSAAIACNDNTCASRSSVTFSTVAGSSYRIQVGSFSLPSEGTFYLSVKAPANDACADAIPLVEGANAGNNALALTDGTVPAASCGTSPGKDVWYSYANPAACPRQVLLSLCPADGGSAAFDSVIRVFSGTDCSALAEIACNDDFCGPQSRLVFAAAPGGAYRISVSSDLGGAGGPFSLHVAHTCASAAQAGAGCSQGGGPGPMLSSNPPVIGSTLVLAITGAAPNAGGVLFFGAPLGGSTALPGGCTFFLDPFAFNILLTLTTSGSGAWSLPAPLANDPGLECVSADLQALLFPPAGYQATSCLRLVVGH
jgi:hypothetical protein